MPKRVVASTASRKDGHDGLLAERDWLMGEIALRARLDPLPPMLVKARTLLTRFWGKASWEARSEILAVARMLTTLGAAQTALRAERDMPQGRPARIARAPRRQKVAAPHKGVESVHSGREAPGSA